MKTLNPFRLTLVALLLVVAAVSAFASPQINTPTLTRATYPLGVQVPDTAAFTIEGGTGATIVTTDTTQSFYIGGLAQGATGTASASVISLLRVTVTGMPTGVAVDTIYADVDYSNSPNGPWATNGNTGTGADITLLLLGPAAASDTTGVGYVKANYQSVGLPANQALYSGSLALAGTSVARTAPFLWQYARLRFAGDHGIGLASTLLSASVSVGYQVDLLPQISATPRR